MLEIIIPARDEERSLPKILTDIRSALPQARVIVIDNASIDRTGEMARTYGADEVVKETKVGKGYAVFTGLSSSKTDRPFFCDADIVGLDWANLPELLQIQNRSSPLLQRLAIERNHADSPVTSLLARPLLEAIGHAQVREPLGGLFSLDKAVLSNLHVPGGWGVDVSITLACLRNQIEIQEILCNGITHRSKPLADYQNMATQVAKAMAQSLGVTPWDHSDCVLCCSKNVHLHKRNERVSSTTI